MLTVRHKSIFTLLLTAAVCFAILFSLCFIAAEADHDCIGDGCPICCQLAVCDTVLKTLVCVVISGLFSALLVCFISVLSAFTQKHILNTSPVCLKVKLSD